MDRHCKVTGRLMLCQADLKLVGQNFVELCVQHCNGAGFGAGQFFFQWDRVFELPNTLQDLHDHGDRARVVEQCNKTGLYVGTAEELIRSME